MKRECEFCAGSGQQSHFLGVSRFLLSWEECSQCGGLGFIIDDDHEPDLSEQKDEKKSGK